MWAALPRYKRKKRSGHTEALLYGIQMEGRKTALGRFWTGENKEKPRYQAERLNTAVFRWSECNYRTWKNPAISMVLAQQARDSYHSKLYFEKFVTQICFKWRFLYSKYLLPLGRIQKPIRYFR